MDLLNTQIGAGGNLIPNINNSAQLTVTNINALLQDPKSVLPEEVRNSLHILLIDANGDVDKFLNNIGEFYISSVDRVTGWFKRHTQILLFILGFAICLLLNADTVYISKTLWQNKDQLKQTADAIQNQLQNNPKAFQNSDTSNIKSLSSKLDSLLKKTDILPMGYNDDNNNFLNNKFYTQDAGDNAVKISYKILGLLITTLAIYLGAPFWFDLVNKIINIRGTGKKPDDSGRKS